ncbi:hypothetical protein [Streptomyces sp. NBC_00996]|uniref:hypothetical protein n=1 Tax=Streptomyces sp. NBC_00996 TaxID=2903710 RepID=UPI003863FA93
MGLVAYDGDRVSGGDLPTVSTGRDTPTALGDPVNPLDDVPNSTISGPEPARRVPAYPNTLGYDSGVLERGKGIRRAGDQLALLDVRVVRPLGGQVSPTGSASDPLADPLIDSVADDEIMARAGQLI